MSPEAVKQFAKLLWQPLLTRFQGIEAQLQEQRVKIDYEVGLASELRAHRARQEVSLYQHQGRRHRSDQIKQWANSQDWRIQHDMRERRVCYVSVEAGSKITDILAEIKRALLLDKISNYDYTSIFSEARSQRHKNTGLWLFQNLKFQQSDQEGESCGLWCHGIRWLSLYN